LKELAGFAASAGSGFSIHLAGAPWWAVMLVVLVTFCVFLASLHMSYRHVYRLASLAHTGRVKGAGGIEWAASSEFEERPP
jgi:hypothetical protein